jgi:hypothetical protein
MSGGFMSYEEALDFVSRDDRFKGTVYAMNTLLIHKGIYTRDEFEKLFMEWAGKEICSGRVPPRSDGSGGVLPA